MFKTRALTGDDTIGDDAVMTRTGLDDENNDGVTVIADGSSVDDKSKDEIIGDNNSGEDESTVTTVFVLGLMTNIVVYLASGQYTLGMRTCASFRKRVRSNQRHDSGDEMKFEKL